MIDKERRRESIRQIAYEEGFHDGYAQALSEMPKIIRCKDCKYEANMYKCPVYYAKERQPNDWFCADGQPR